MKNFQAIHKHTENTHYYEVMPFFLSSLLKILFNTNISGQTWLLKSELTWWNSFNRFGPYTMYNSLTQLLEHLLVSLLLLITFENNLVSWVQKQTTCQPVPHAWLLLWTAPNVKTWGGVKCCFQNKNCPRSLRNQVCMTQWAIGASCSLTDSQTGTGIIVPPGATVQAWLFSCLVEQTSGQICLVTSSRNSLTWRNLMWQTRETLTVLDVRIQWWVKVRWVTNLKLSVTWTISADMSCEFNAGVSSTFSYPWRTLKAISLVQTTVGYILHHVTLWVDETAELFTLVPAVAWLPPALSDVSLLAPEVES